SKTGGVAGAAATAGSSDGKTSMSNDVGMSTSSGGGTRAVAFFCAVRPAGRSGFAIWPLSVRREVPAAAVNRQVVFARANHDVSPRAVAFRVSGGVADDVATPKILDRLLELVLQECGVGREVGVAAGDADELLETHAIDVGPQTDREDRGIHRLGDGDHVGQRLTAAGSIAGIVLVAAVGHDHDRP